MEIKINDMRPAASADGTVAHFWCEADGWRLHGCRIARMPDGFLRVATARAGSRTSAHRRAVEPPAEIWDAFVRAALRAFTTLPKAETRAVNESIEDALRIAGI